jgi:ABC-2 type transport system ATP-binding protein
VGGPMIQVESIGKFFGGIEALAGVSLYVGAGELVGLLGPNGAGKTTLVRVLSTLLRPDAGRALVAGHDVVRNPSAVRSAIGLAGQAAALDELLTGRENLEFIGRLYGLSRAACVSRADEVLERFGLRDAASRRTSTYSGGMRRRLDLGATLVGRPAVLLLDEPTAGLDPRGRTELWGLISEVVQAGTAVVLTSQYLEEVERLADRIVVIDQGLVVAEGTATELKRQIGGDVLEARLVDAAHLAGAEALLHEVGDGPVQVAHDDLRVVVPTAIGMPAVVAAARRFEDSGIALADLGIRRPSLDEVFLSLTGPEAVRFPPPQQSGVERPHPPSDTDVAAPTHASPARFVTNGAAVTRRYLLRLWRTPQLLFFALVQPVLFVVGLDAVFGGLVTTFLGGNYIEYLLPGLVVTNGIITAGMTGAGLADDLQAGIIDRFRSLPMARSAVVVGRTLSDLARNIAAISLMLIVGVIMGFRPDGGIPAAIAALAIAVLFIYAATWLFAAVGLAVKDPQAANFAGFAPVMPLVFLSGAWLPVAAMGGGVQAFARNQPVNVTVEAVRGLVNGDPASHWVWQSIAWSLGLLVVFCFLAVRQYRTALS